jgi:alkylation response protein AidB-like acyl-CoA dehydrogenase
MGSVIPDNGAGTDEAVRRMTACREGEAYVINGEQAFVVNGSIADHLVVSCVPAGPAEATNWRSSLFVVGTGSPGCEVFKLKGRLGLRACDAARVRLSGVRVTEKELLGGGEGGGSDRVRPFLDGKRLEAAALSIGIAEGAMEQAVAYARQRRAFGRCVAAFESTQLKVAEMGAYIEASRRLCFEAAWLLDHGRRDSGLVSMAGWFAGMTGIRVVDEALQLHGGYGYITESRIERFFRDATMAENYGGCGESEKVSIGGAVIGPV